MSFIDEKVVQEGMTFDDVLLIPAYSEVTPNMVSLAGRFSRNTPAQYPVCVCCHGHGYRGGDGDSYRP